MADLAYRLLFVIARWHAVELPARHKPVVLAPTTPAGVSCDPVPQRQDLVAMHAGRPASPLPEKALRP